MMTTACAGKANANSTAISQFVKLCFIRFSIL
jgi:hypothetical protein